MRRAGSCKTIDCGPLGRKTVRTLMPGEPVRVCRVRNCRLGVCNKIGLALLVFSRPRFAGAQP